MSRFLIVQFWRGFLIYWYTDILIYWYTDILIYWVRNLSIHRNSTAVCSSSIKSLLNVCSGRGCEKILFISVLWNFAKEIMIAPEGLHEKSHFMQKMSLNSKKTAFNCYSYLLGATCVVSEPAHSRAVCVHARVRVCVRACVRTCVRACVRVCVRACVLCPCYLR